MTDHNNTYKTPVWTDGPDIGNKAVPTGESWDMGGGDDSFFAWGGNDQIVAGSGNDSVQGDSGDDILYGQTGNDRLEGGADNDSLHGGFGDDTLYGDSGNDVLNGNEGNDFLDGGTGLNSMAGGDGNDTYFVDDNGDKLTEAPGQGTDTVRSTMHYMLGANVENLILEGGGSTNGTGNALANKLIGNSGVNMLHGGDGNDVLDGGAGADTLVGGNGDDVFIFDAADLAPAGTRLFGQSGLDTIKVTQNNELLNLTAIDDDRIAGVDAVDLSAAGTQSIRLGASDIRAMGDFPILRVIGTADDRVTVSGTWGQATDVTIGRELYHSYSGDGTTLWIDADIGVMFA